jgi:predicted AAA+ superfamily ATPase
MICLKARSFLREDKGRNPRIPVRKQFPLNALAQLLLPKSRIYYWRTTTGKEIDFVLE